MNKVSKEVKKEREKQFLRRRNTKQRDQGRKLPD